MSNHNITHKDSENSTDQYGNNTNFPDSIMSDISRKGLLGKWTEDIYNDAKICLIEYYRKNSSDVGNVKGIRYYFDRLDEKISYLTPVLEDLVEENIWGMEDIFISVFGVGSDQVYVFRRFLGLSRKREWDTDWMWNDAAGNHRLHDLICPKEQKVR